MTSISGQQTLLQLISIDSLRDAMRTSISRLTAIQSLRMCLLLLLLRDFD